MSALQPGVVPSDDPWIVHRETLRQLYIAENKTLKEVKSIMESLNGFPEVPESTYESKLRDYLGLRKNLKTSDWQVIEHHLEKRKREGKEESEVIHNDILIPPKKVRKEVTRNRRVRMNASTMTYEPMPSEGSCHQNASSKSHAFQSLEANEDQFLTLTSSASIVQGRGDNETILQATEDMEWLSFIHSEFNTTPVSGRNKNIPFGYIGFHSVSFDRLPWFQFQLSLKMAGLGPMSVADQIFHSGNFPVNELSQRGSQNNSLTLEKRHEVISSLLPNSVDTSRLVVTMYSLLPEQYGGEIDQKLEILKDSSRSCSAAQVAELAIYLISNNLISGLDNFLKWSTEEIPKSALGSILNLQTPTVQTFKQRAFERVAFLGEDHFKALVAAEADKSYLTGPIGQRCLQIAAHWDEIEVVQILLDLGVPPDTELSNDDDGYCFDRTPLHHAASRLNCDMVKLLLNAGADVNCLDLGGLASPLSRAVDGISFPLGEGEVSYDCIYTLIKAGANVDVCGSYSKDWKLLDEIYFDDKKLYRILLASSKAAKTELTVSGILDAAIHGLPSLQQYLDDRKANPRGEIFQLSLLRATQSCSAALVPLLQLGVDPDCPSFTESPLVKAIRRNRIDLVSKLLGHGADINLPGVLCASAGSPVLFHILGFLVQQGADVCGFGGKALAEAIRGDNLSAVKLLLISGVDVNSWIPDDGTPLSVAAGRGNLETIDYLIKAGADVNATERLSASCTALHAALKYGKWAAGKFLLECGANIGIDGLGTTLLEACLTNRASHEMAQMFELLLSKGAQINGPPKRPWCTSWNSALSMLIKQDAEERMILLALNAGADVNQAGCGHGSSTPVQAAASKGNLELVKELHRRGADINASAGTIYGRTALQAACCLDFPNLELVQFLLDNGADVNARAGIQQGLTAIQGAAIQGHIKVATLLLDYGANVNGNAAAIDGRTALDGAAENGRLDMVQFLLNVGARSEVAGRTGYDRAIALAKKEAHFVVADVLQSHSRNS